MPDNLGYVPYLDDRRRYILDGGIDVQIDGTMSQIPWGNASSRTLLTKPPETMMKAMR